MNSPHFLRRAVAAAGLVLASLLAGCATAGGPRSLVEGVVLGPPVALPPGVDPKYAAEALKTAFAAAVEKAGLDIVELAVDESEFPFLLYGAIGSRGGVLDLKAIMARMPGYRYVGSVTSRNLGYVAFALDVTPGEQYPAGQAQAIQATIRERRREIVRRLDLARR